MTNTSYSAGEVWWRYPAAGDEEAPKSSKCLLLTIGGICVVGTWRDLDCVAWSPMPRRNYDKERFVTHD